MVGIPEVAAEAPFLFELAASCVIELPLVLAQSFRIDAAFGTDAAITDKNLIPQVPRVGTQLPLMNTLRAAKRETTRGDLNAAPPARATPPGHPTARLGPARAHTRSS
jgi:hypothetical protein